MTDVSDTQRILIVFSTLCFFAILQVLSSFVLPLFSNSSNNSRSSSLLKRLQDLEDGLIRHNVLNKFRAQVSGDICADGARVDTGCMKPFEAVATIYLVSQVGTGKLPIRIRCLVAVSFFFEVVIVHCPEASLRDGPRRRH